MKREYSYGSIILLEIIFGIISLGLFFAFGKDASDNIIYNLITAIITWLGSFLIVSGLINNRKGSVGDYFNQIHRLDKKAILVNLILVGLTVLITTVFGGGAAFLAIKNKPTSSFMSMGIVGALLSALIALFTAYANHVVSDPRNKGQSVGDAFKSVFSIGKKLLGKTILTCLKYFILPIIVIIGISIAATMSADSFNAIIGLIFITFIVFAIYFLLISPIVAARIADNYLDLTGDIENNNGFTINRNI